MAENKTENIIMGAGQASEENDEVISEVHHWAAPEGDSKKLREQLKSEDGKE